MEKIQAKPNNALHNGSFNVLIQISLVLQLVISLLATIYRVYRNWPLSRCMWRHPRRLLGGDGALLARREGNV